MKDITLVFALGVNCTKGIVENTKQRALYICIYISKKEMKNLILKYNFFNLV